MPSDPMTMKAMVAPDYVADEFNKSLHYSPD